MVHTMETPGPDTDVTVPGDRGPLHPNPLHGGTMQTKKSLLTILGLAAAGALALSGCSANSPGGGSTDTPAGESEYTIGISQFVQHPALDATVAGFKKAFADAGVTATFDEQNSNADSVTATTIASKFAADKVDLVLAVATPSAQAAAQAITDIPILFTAVTEPLDAELVDSWEKPGGNVTGSSDLNPVAEQLALITQVQPDAKSVGIIYSSGEANSQVQVDLAKEAAKDLGLEIKESAIAESRDITQAADSLGDVDAIYVPTDNKITEALQTLIGFGESKQIPIYGAEVNQVQEGAIVTIGIDYEKLGEQTGKMALAILQDGKDPATMPVETLDELILAVNPAAAERMGVTLPEELTSKADVTVK